MRIKIFTRVYGLPKFGFIRNCQLVLSKEVYVQIARVQIPWNSLCDVLLHDGDFSDTDSCSVLAIGWTDQSFDWKSDANSNLNSSRSSVISWGSVYSNIPHSRKDHVELTRTCHSDASGLDANSVESSVASYSETGSVQSGHPSSYSPGHQNNSPDYIISLRNMNEARVKYHRSLLIEETPLVSLLDILVSRRGSGVSDLRDINYGHLAIADLSPSYPKRWDRIACINPENYKLVVDYRKSVNDVFIDAARYIYHCFC